MNNSTPAIVAETVNVNELDHSRGGKFLTFFLKDEEYGIEILKVQEIVGILPVTRVPRTPHFIRGVVNLRGKIIPVTDLRLRFNMEEGVANEENCIIVVRTAGIEIGLIVDKVSEVLAIAESEVEGVPSFGTEVKTEYLLGIGKTASSVILLLNIDRVITMQDVMSLRSSLQEVEALA